MLCKDKVGCPEGDLGLPALKAGHVPRMPTLEFCGLGSELLYCNPTLHSSQTDTHTHTSIYSHTKGAFPSNHTEYYQMKQCKFFRANDGAKTPFVHKRNGRNVDVSESVPKGLKASLMSAANFRVRLDVDSNSSKLCCVYICKIRGLQRK